MRRIFISLIVIFSSAILLNGNSTAGDIDKGTWSLGGSSNINYSMSDFDENNVESSNIFNLTMSGGYFVAKNFEIELGIGFIRQEIDDNKSTNYNIIPMINYHFPIKDNINIYSGIGVRWEKNEYDTNSYSSDIESFGYGIKVGLELFIVTNAAITFEASYWKIEWDNDNAQDDLSENRLIIPQIGIKLYF